MVQNGLKLRIPKRKWFKWLKFISVNKSQFAELNDKRYYFSEGIGPFSHGYPLLLSLQQEKNEFKEKINNEIVKVIKFDMLKEKCAIISECERLQILRSILLQSSQYYKLDSSKRTFAHKNHCVSIFCICFLVIYLF